MRYRRLDENGDMCFGQGGYNYCLGSEAVAQAIKTKIKLLKNEWWEDLEDGTPLFESILSQKATPEGVNAIDIIIKARILEVPNVSSVSSFVSRIVDREYEATLNIETTFGMLEGFNIEF